MSKSITIHKLVAEFVLSRLLDDRIKENRDFIEWVSNKWSKNMCDNYLPYLIVIMGKCGMGKLMFISNKKIKEIIRNRTYEDLLDIFKFYFPELESKELTKDELNYLYERLNKELEISFKTYETIYANINTIKGEIDNLLIGCHDEICEDIQKEDFRIPENLYVVDYDRNGEKQFSCIPLKTLLRELSKKESINPTTGCHFSEETLESLRKIKIYSKLWKFYLEEGNLL